MPEKINELNIQNTGEIIPRDKEKKEEIEMTAGEELDIESTKCYKC